MFWCFIFAKIWDKWCILTVSEWLTASQIWNSRVPRLALMYCLTEESQTVVWTWHEHGFPGLKCCLITRQSNNEMLMLKTWSVCGLTHSFISLGWPRILRSSDLFETQNRKLFWLKHELHIFKHTGFQQKFDFIRDEKGSQLITEQSTRNNKETILIIN